MMSRRIYVSSSNVNYFCYDDEEKILEVGFKHRNGNEPIYHYYHVPAKIWYGLMNASSKGEYVWSHIRTNPPAFEYELQNYSNEDIVPERIYDPDNQKTRKKQWWNLWS